MADGKGGTDKSPVDNQEASEITNQSAEPVEIGDNFNSSEADSGALDLSKANKNAATNLPEASDGSETPTILNTLTAEHAPIMVNEKEITPSYDSVSDAANEPQTRVNDFTRAFNNTAGVPILSHQERIILDDATTEHTPLNSQSHMSERGKKRKGSSADSDMEGKSQG